LDAEGNELLILIGLDFEIFAAIGTVDDELLVVAKELVKTCLFCCCCKICKN